MFIRDNITGKTTGVGKSIQGSNGEARVLHWGSRIKFFWKVIGWKHLNTDNALANEKTTRAYDAKLTI